MNPISSSILKTVSELIFRKKKAIKFDYMSMGTFLYNLNQTFGPEIVSEEHVCFL